MISVIRATLKSILTGSNPYTDVALRRFEIDLQQMKRKKKCQLNILLARHLCSLVSLCNYDSINN